MTNKEPQASPATASKTLRLPLLTNLFRRNRQPSIDLNTLNHEDDVKTLREEDPFLYHSIPMVQKARLSLNDVDDSTLVTALNGASDTSWSIGGLQDDHEDSPSRQSRSSSSSSSSSVVQRKTRLSTECDQSAALEDLLELDDEEFKARCQEDGVDFDALQDDVRKQLGW